MDREHSVGEHSGPDYEALLERVTSLESALAHHQRDYDLLNGVVVEQADLLAKLQRKLTALEASLKTVESRIPEDRDLADEKPPHY